MKKIFFVVLLVLFLSSCKQEETVPSLENEFVDTRVEETEANEPIILTPSPVIHLADNLDEQDRLGFCIDTRGNGFIEELHAHSCKANGGDVQFYYNPETLQICSAEFIGFCIEMSGGPIQGMSLRLV